MTNGTAAGLVIKELIQCESHPWAVLSHARRMPWQGYRELAQLNWVLTRAYLVDHLSAFRQEDPAALAPGAGEVGKLGFRCLTVFRDEAGELGAVSPICKHLGFWCAGTRRKRVSTAPATARSFPSQGRFAMARHIHR